MEVTRAALAAIRAAFHHNVGVKAAASLAVVSLAAGSNFGNG